MFKRLTGIIFVTLACAACFSGMQEEGASGQSSPTSNDPLPGPVSPGEAPPQDPTPTPIPIATPTPTATPTPRPSTPTPFPTPTPTPSADIQAVITPSRTTCVAPCGIFFDGTNSNGPVVNPFHELEYQWTFGDPTASFTYRPGVDANRAKGSLAAHVYAQPGDYSVTLEVFDSRGGYNQAQIQVLVQDPEVVFMPPQGTTYCVSASNQFADCPMSDTRFHLTQIDQAIPIAASVSGSRRLLLHRGETFTRVILNPQREISGPFLIGAYGTGSPPTLFAASTGNGLLSLEGSDITITQLRFLSTYDPHTGLGAHPSAITMNSGTSFVTIFRNTFSNLGLNMQLGQSGEFRDSDVADNFVTSWQDYGILSGDIERVAIIGNSIKQNLNAVSGSEGKCGTCLPNFPDHGPMRLRSTFKALVSQNDLFNNAGWSPGSNGEGAHQPNIRIPSSGRAERSIVSDNLMEGGDSIAGGGPSNDSIVAEIGEIIWERNRFVATSASRNYLGTAFGGALIRNNIFIQPNTGGAIVAAISFGSVTNSTTQNRQALIQIYGNTFVSAEMTPDGTRAFLLVEDNSMFNFDVKNNIFYAPYMVQSNEAFLRWDSASAPLSGLTSDHNVVSTGTTTFALIRGASHTFSSWQTLTNNDRATIIANPLFVDDPLSTDPRSADLHLQSASPARDAGENLNALLEDLQGISRPDGDRQGNGTCDIGAFESVP